MRITRLGRVAGAVAVVAVAALGWGNVTQAQTKLRVSASKATVCIPLYAAQEKRYYAEEGLEVEFVPWPSGSKVLEFVHLAQVHVGTIAAIPFITAASRGANVIAVADQGNYGPGSPQQALVVRADSDIRALKDLEGKTVAVNGFGTHGDVVLRGDVFPKAGLQVGGNGTVVELPWPQMEAALTSRSIHVALAYEPFATRMAGKPDYRILSWLEDTIPPEGYVVSLLIMNRDWVKANEEVARQFVRAHARGIALQRQDRDEAYRLASGHIGLSVTELKQTREHEFAEGGKIRVDVIRKTAERMKRLGLIDKLPDLDQAIWSGAK